MSLAGGEKVSGSLLEREIFDRCIARFSHAATIDDVSSAAFESLYHNLLDVQIV